MKIGDRVAGQLVGLQWWEGVIEGMELQYIPISPDYRAEYTVSSAVVYTVRIDSSTVVTGLRKDQLTLAEIPAQAYLELFQ